MKVFDDIKRSHTGPSDYSESIYAFLNRSARGSSSKIRTLIQEWYDKYPDKEKADILGRFKSHDNNKFLSTFFELYIYEIVKCLGYDILPHPSIPGESKHPDFLVKGNDKKEFYLEVVLASGVSDEESANAAKMNVVYDIINQLDSPDFFIGIRIKGAPKTPPPARQLKFHILEWLETLNFDDITTIISTNGLGDLPLLNFTHDGWEIEFFPIPKDPQYRGKSGIRPIGMQTPEAVMVKSKKIIKQAISKKATRYGKMNKPYLIAVNDISFLTDEEDRIEALFGTEQFHILLSGQEQLFAGSNRKPDGFWVGPNGIQNTRVSAVMIADQILPWSIHNQSVRIYHNPWAQIPLQGLINRLPQATACENQMQYEVGIHPHELLKIPLDWIRKNYSE